MKIDEYEKEILELEEKGLIKSGPPNPKEKKALVEAARSTLQKDRRINIRISNRDLVSLKRKANRFGMPYQTLISSVLHRYISGDIQVEPTGSDATRSRS
jgi:predicted DNA binding CopG/RHH family protein